jgi:hypothetical protein
VFQKEVLIEKFEKSKVLIFDPFSDLKNEEKNFWRQFFFLNLATLPIQDGVNSYRTIFRKKNVLCPTFTFIKNYSIYLRK